MFRVSEPESRGKKPKTGQGPASHPVGVSDLACEERVWPGLEVEEEKEVGAGIVLFYNVPVKPNAAQIKLVTVEIAHKASVVTVLRRSVLFIPHARKCINDNTADDADEDEDKEQPKGDIPEKPPRKCPLPHQSICDVCREDRGEEHILDAVLANCPI